MKYKDRKNAKRKYKQALLATVATMTLGVSTLGSTASVFAAENTETAQQVVPQQPQGAAKSNDLNFDTFQKSVLNGDHVSTITETHFKNIKPTGTQVLEVAQDILDNTGSSRERNMTVAKHTLKKLNSISRTSGSEFTFGQELSVEASGKAGIPLLADASLKTAFKLTFGQKITRSATALESIEHATEYGGGTQAVEAGKKLKVSYVLEQGTFSGTAVNRKQINNIDTYTSDTYPSGLKLKAVKVLASPNNLQDYYGEKTPYEIFKFANKFFDTSYLILEYANPENYNEYVVFGLPMTELRKKLDIDDEHKEVYLKENEMQFKSAYGTQITQQIIDVDSGQALEGWKQEKGLWYCYDNGKKLTGWLPDNDEWYYLSPEAADGFKQGQMRTGWLQDGDEWYYLSPKAADDFKQGQMRTGWLQVGDEWYYLNPETANGFKKGQMVTGNLSIKKADGTSHTYHFNESGACTNPNE
ncbi:hypothetical protein V7095_23565 [Bacillus thuringiensis]|uniref:hypothetical protein n=1 Tax=Bacillus thuringiensis TaxID=1428 RepID=UPI0013E62B4E